MPLLPVARASTLLGGLAGVCVLTAATQTGSLRVTSLASSPSRIAHGKLWLLLTSGLVVQRPVVISLVCFAALAGLALGVCGARLSWIIAVAGHVCSTLLAYAALAALRPFEEHSYHSLLTRPDYGVSAISAAWLGAVAAAGWRRRGQTTRGRLAIVLAVVMTALFAFMLRRGLTVLDSDHVIAFAIGVALVGRTSRKQTRLATAAAATS